MERQLEVYREDPDRHLPSLCAAVGEVVLGDGTRGGEVREEIEKALEVWRRRSTSGHPEG
jgi:hypothetical protein